MRKLATQRRVMVANFRFQLQSHYQKSDHKIYRSIAMIFRNSKHGRELVYYEFACWSLNKYDCMITNVDFPLLYVSVPHRVYIIWPCEFGVGNYINFYIATAKQATNTRSQVCFSTTASTWHYISVGPVMGRPFSDPSAEGCCRSRDFLFKKHSVHKRSYYILGHLSTL